MLVHTIRSVDLVIGLLLLRRIANHEAVKESHQIISRRNSWRYRAIPLTISTWDSER